MSLIVLYETKKREESGEQMTDSMHFRRDMPKNARTKAGASSVNKKKEV